MECLQVFFTADQKQARVQKITKGESLMINVGSTSTGGRVLAIKGDLAKVQLSRPVCTEQGEKIALSRRVEKHWRLIGWGKIFAGKTVAQARTEKPGTVQLPPPEDI